MASPLTAHATALPSSTDPLRQQQGLTIPETTVSPLPPPSGREAPGAVAVPAGAEALHLTLQDITLDGNTVYDAATVQAQIAPLLGHDITLADIFRLADQLTQQYQRDGYVLARVSVPPQEITAGVVKLAVMEGYIAELEIEESARLTTDMQSIVARLRTAPVFNIASFEQDLLLINDMGGPQFYAVFQPTITPPERAGGVRVLLKSENAMTSGGVVSFDNRGSAYLGPYQGHASYMWRDTPLRQDRLSLSTSASLPLEESRQLAVAYERYIGSHGLKLGMSAHISRTEPGEELRRLDVHSVARSVQLDLSYPLIRSRAENLSVGASLEAAYAVSKILGVQNYADNLRISRLSANWQKADRWAGITLLNPEVSFGLPLLGGSHSHDADLSREDARLDFTKWALTAMRQQYLGPDWMLTLSTAGQYSATPLASSQEFGVGGSAFGRAYNPSELTGDQGIAAALEVQYSGLTASEQPWFPTLYGYYDIGTVWNLDSSASTDKRSSAASAGFGARWSIADKAELSAEVALPLTLRPQDDTSKAPRLFVTGNVKF